MANIGFTHDTPRGAADSWTLAFAGGELGIVKSRPLAGARWLRSHSAVNGAIILESLDFQDRQE